MMNMLTEEIKEIGDIFKKRRKELNLSLKEVENATSIRMAYLQALEEGEMEKMISPVYAQGFLKQYANFLGVDGEAIIREHPEIFNRKQAQEFAYGIGTLEMRGNPGAGVKWVPNAVWLIAFALLVLVGFYIGKFFQLF
jgi:cytoskeletal protein RodZ